jgi:NAD(P)-dependent dehydrogenase (short-subunit alcohol dehydrogenase family)
MASAFDVSERKIFVTGAGRGIGVGIAEVLAHSGAQVAMNALTARYVVDAAQRIAASSGTTVVPVIADLTDEDGVAAAIGEVIDRLGGIDVLVNCLGDSIDRPLAGTLDDATVMDRASLELALGVNLKAAILCCRAVGPLLIRQGSGKVINISSISAIRGGKGRSVYTAAKAGVIGLTQALALEWAPYGIQVNAISPGVFRSDVATTGAMIPAGRVGDPREVGYITQYFASSASDYVTGQHIAIDGGRSLDVTYVPPVAPSGGPV